MKVFEIQGKYAPSRLARELRAAGIDVQGVTATEGPDGVVSAVQVVCGDTATRAAITAVTSVHDPRDPAPVHVPTDLERAVNAVVSADDFDQAKANLAALVAAAAAAGRT